MSENIVIELVAREKTYSSKELSDQLGIGLSTLRKWSSLLEQNGYSFQRDSRSRREYRQVDTIALRKMRELTKESLLPLESAAASIAASMHSQQAAAAAETLPVLSAPAEVRRPLQSYQFQLLEQKIDSLAKHVQQQDAFQTSLLERLDKQEKYISINLKERDRRLTKAMDEILQNKIHIAELRDHERKKSIWHRLFKIT